MDAPRDRDQSPKGRTTHPYLTLQLLTDGAYDAEAGLFRSATGRVCYYVASDNLCNQAYAALTPDLVIAATERAGLRFDLATESGVVFHMLGALSEFGKLGAVCIAPTRMGAQALFAELVAMLEREAEHVAAGPAWRYVRTLGYTSQSTLSES